ncbi:hypothetical protein GCM10010439_00810 [Actinocorallia aurantiaca]|uniref:Uncharacterized protein n=1 Tax=Actinocorallia aurantiaca TaxID=46204 RepID=A0ABP6G749_9ACTN
MTAMPDESPAVRDDLRAAFAAPKGAFAGRDRHSKPDGVAMVLEVTLGGTADSRSSRRRSADPRVLTRPATASPWVSGMITVCVVSVPPTGPGSPITWKGRASRWCACPAGR